MTRNCYLGIDVGSVSAKMVIIDENNNIVAKTYKKNDNVIDTLIKCFSDLKSQVNINEINILGVGCTGSGRLFTKVVVGADVIKTEILAHLTATQFYIPNVNTIFDIGGEDCKIITLQDGEWNGYIMNNICGAGTGAVITNVANLLNVDITEVGDVALKSKNVLSFPGKCGVLCQSAVINRKNMGANNEDILMGVCKALINNYLSLAKNITLKEPYVFQGMTAKNKALVKSLSDYLNKDIIVLDNCEYMGAIGIALLTKEQNIITTNFKGFNLDITKIKSKNFICKKCSNECEVLQVYYEDKFIDSLNSRCGLWNNKEV